MTMLGISLIVSGLIFLAYFIGKTEGLKHAENNNLVIKHLTDAGILIITDDGTNKLKVQIKVPDESNNS